MRHLELEDRRADVAHGGVEVVDGGDEPRRHDRVVDEPLRRLQAQAHCEQALDHGVVEVAGDPLAVLERRQFGDACVQACVLDGEAGDRRQVDDERLVVVGELATADLVAQVDVAEHVAADRDRRSEERRHRRVVRGEPDSSPGAG